jgi:hypothetical protein
MHDSDTGFRNLLGAAKKASDVNPNDYDVVFYAGGHEQFGISTKI